ncbi:TNT domain-containing protein [Streptomyces malaysiensis]|uniref:TNT domain-containing protein n=1 Tax=Streptomyces malaysiensis TaxID=92644 RepID=UPI00352B2B91
MLIGGAGVGGHVQPRYAEPSGRPHRVDQRVEHRRGLLTAGFLHTTVRLKVGQKVDLFGSGFGHFLAPAGTPYAERALPPSNLNTLDPAYPNGYHLYEVTQSFLVEAGPIRSWFGQPGFGLQYLTGPSIPQLVAAGNLRPLN